MRRRPIAVAVLAVLGLTACASAETSAVDACTAAARAREAPMVMLTPDEDATPQVRIGPDGRSATVSGLRIVAKEQTETMDEPRTYRCALSRPGDSDEWTVERISHQT